MLRNVFSFCSKFPLTRWIDAVHCSSFMLLLWKFDLISQNLQMFVFCQQRLEHNLNINYQSFLSIAPVFAKRGLGQSQSWIHFCSYIYICICIFFICISDVCLALRLSIRASWQFVSEPLLGQSAHWWICHLAMELLIWNVTSKAIIFKFKYYSYKWKSKSK